MTHPVKGPDRTVSNRVTCGALRYALAEGMSAETFATKTGVGAGDLIDPRGRIDGGRHRKVIELVATLAVAPPLLGVSVAGLLGDFPALGSLCLNGRTVRGAIGDFLAFRSLIGEFDFMLQKQTATRIEFEYVSEFAPSNASQALANFTVLAALIRTYDQQSPTRFHTGFVGPAPAFAPDIDALFGSAARYRQSKNTLWFESASLDDSVQHHNVMLAPHLLHHAVQERLAIEQKHLFSVKVERLIKAFMADPERDLSEASVLDHVCAHFNTSRWTLQRQLKQEDTHFCALEIKVKTSESRRLLSDTALSVAEISDRLGFASQSAFTRFFRAHHPLSPTYYRRHHAGRRHPG